MNSHFTMPTSDDASVSSFGSTQRRGSFNPAQHLTTSRSKGVNMESAWVKRTYCMVNEGNETQPHVLSWSADGEVFEIRDVNALKNDLFKKFHGDTKFESFTRRLRRYGFHREKIEPLTKGRGVTVVLAFRHESFKRDRPDLLSNLTILPPSCEAVKAPEETCPTGTTDTLSRLEKMQEDLKSSMRQFEEQKNQHKRQIDQLRQEGLSKDETIRSLEFRLETLENNLLKGQGFSRKFSPPLWARKHSQKNHFGSQQLAVEAPATIFQPLKGSPSALMPMPAKPLMGRGLSLEREVSAIGLLPLLDDLQQQEGGGTHLDEEPTLPRSKKMKLFHKGMSEYDLLLDGIGLLSRQTTPINHLFQSKDAHDLLDSALSRQTTPIVWSLPCL